MWFLKYGYRQLAKAALLGCALGLATPSIAKDLNAGAVLHDMDQNAQFPFISGIVEGLGYARFRADGKTTDGMACIYRWFYEEDGSYDNILAAFAKFQDRTPGAIIAALIQRRCSA